MKFRSFLKRAIPLLCACVFLLQLIPAVPAAAADETDAQASTTVSGVWYFNETHDNFFDGWSGAMKINFESGGYQFNHLTVTSAGGLEYSYVSNSSCVCGNGRACSASQNVWVFTPDRGIYLPGAALDQTIDASAAFLSVDFGETAQPVSQDFYDWLSLNASRDSPGYLGSFIVYVDSVPYEFTGYSTDTRSISLNVNSGGCSLTCGNGQSFTIPYKGSGTLVGYAFGSSSNSAMYFPNSSYTLGKLNEFSSVRIFTVEDTSSVISAGHWVCKDSILQVDYGSPDPWPDSLDSVDFFFTSGGQSFTSISVGTKLGSLADYLRYGSTPVYCYGDSVDAAGWVSTSYASVTVAAAQKVDPAFYDWFTGCFTLSSGDDNTPVKTTVNIYDSTGKVLLKTISFSGSTAPEVTLAVTSSGCTLTSGDNVQSWVASSGFYGLSLKADSSSASYSIGDSYVFPGGSSVDQVLSFYVVSERDHGGSGGSFGDGSGVGTLFAGFGDFLSTVLSGFLSFQIVPGLSFGGMVEFFIYLALVLLFLRLVK